MAGPGGSLCLLPPPLSLGTCSATINYLRIFSGRNKRADCRWSGYARCRGRLACVSPRGAQSLFFFFFFPFSPIATFQASPLPAATSTPSFPLPSKKSRQQLPSPRCLLCIITITPLYSPPWGQKPS
ncbi:hypothetical protein LX36DRAFT_499579 [Colletotrichum falcatum]|nr:hypothetical protein LX36DRAFT_499579 [Colletotrichum falcatum]